MPPTDPTIKFAEFRGINNQSAQERLEPVDLRVANNVDISNSGRVARRKGYTLSKAGNYHSLTQLGGISLIVDEDSAFLCRVYDDLSFNQLAALSAPNARISYAKAHDSIYYTNGTDSGRIDSDGNYHAWPKTRPQFAPLLSATDGGLKPGYYSVAVTFAGDNGLETPPRFSAQTRLSETAGLLLSNLPVSDDPDLPYTNIYCTNPSGENYFFVATVTGSTPVKIQTGFFTVPLRTLHMDEAPSANMLCFHEERLYAARDNYLFYSEQHDYEHFRLTEGLFVFESDISVIESTPGGLWVVADRTYFLQGTRPEAMSRITKADTGRGYPFSSVRIDSSALKMDGINGLSAMWCTAFGVCVGTQDGGYFNLTDGRYSPPDLEDASAVTRFENGIHQYLVLGKNTGKRREGYFLGDRAEAEVWRSGTRVQ